jgi:hypothetical protein
MTSGHSNFDSSSINHLAFQRYVVSASHRAIKQEINKQDASVFYFLILICF